ESGHFVPLFPEHHLTPALSPTSWRRGRRNYTFGVNTRSAAGRGADGAARRPCQKICEGALRDHALLHFHQAAFGKLCAELSYGRCGQFFFENAADGVAETFGCFENDVAGEAVGDDDVHGVIEEIESFDVADEIQIQQAAEFYGAAGEVGAFGFLGAIAEDADAGAGYAEEFLGVDVAHDGKLREMER